MELKTQRVEVGVSPDLSDGARSSAKSIAGFPGSVRAVEGVRVIGYANGHFDSGGADFVADLEPYLDDPAQLASRIPVFSGHYALVLASRDRKIAYLIANPFGSEPVYYAQTPAGHAWSFSLKELLPSLATRALDPRGLDEITRYRWLAEDRTLLSGVWQLLPGHYVCLRANAAPVVGRYINMTFSPAPGTGDEDARINATSQALDRYFAKLRRTHAKIAILFSGGVDSSLLVAKARDHAFDKVVAVTAGFPGYRNPEAERAAKIAAQLGVEHRIVDVPDSFVAESMGRLVRQLERPSAYENNFARARIFEQIAPEVGFVLSGEGADGMFGGSDAGKTATEYDAQQKFIDWMPGRLRRALARLAGSVDSPSARRLHHYLSVTAREFIRERGTLDTQGPADGLRVTDLIPGLAAIRQANDRPFYSIYEPQNAASLVAVCQNRGLYSQNRNQFYCYSKLAAPYGIIVDHPFVSPEMTAIGLALPDAMKWNAHGTKPILKKLASRYFSPDLVYAKKLGFETPYAGWLRGPLASWYGLLFDARTASRGLFDPKLIRSLDPGRDSDLIWTAMGLELFMRQFIDLDSEPIR